MEKQTKEKYTKKNMESTLKKEKQKLKKKNMEKNTCTKIRHLGWVFLDFSHILSNNANF